MALADDFLIEAELRSGQLVKLSDCALGGAAYYLLTLERGARRKPIGAFRDWLLAETAAARDARPAG